MLLFDGSPSARDWVQGVIFMSEPQRRASRPVVLAIAGSDSGGGAGIQADLKTLAVLGVHGAAALTALTAQNTQGVRGIHEVPPAFVAAQILAVLDDMDVAAVKTGMLASSPIVEVVAETLRHRATRNIVVDPVMVAQSGDHLLRPDATRALVEQLLPLATLVTPNVPEAEALVGFEVRDLDAMKRAARALVEKGARACLVKGGHLEGDAVDVLYDGRQPLVLRAARLAEAADHGTGCCLASAVAAGLALGQSLPQAVSNAKVFVTRAIALGWHVGRGHGCVNPAGVLLREADRHRLWKELVAAVERLEGAKLGPLVPEVQCQIAFALDGAVTPQEVLAFPGRLVRIGDRLRSVTAPRFGASSHMARVVLAVLRHDPQMRVAMNIRYGKEILEACARARLTVAMFERRDESPASREEEGQSLPHGIRSAIERFGGVPDAIADPGDVGKEPMVRLLARDPDELARKLLRLARELGLEGGG
ncbi:MAG: bifunctional hydroxymethylpyrimidine kinase/phosphomethylpyrimidine kinase [Planctomycetota bacterium]